uniref:FMN hydroxy acid dehydrogenase domain-containing protein n=1 Tax=Fibrocapsa japonica TaxID=94617 RepID=A0A7S2V2J3_9STRA|mmetsp:Transcript_21591/g.31315  ORF Transcript_21591/g.31315 Transcript_21591/m.31315 type:complete len:404 (+) Transcript_21591:76-1287(+)|eukprot:CAMPEP_0113936500 /NCGR_PEP_ID=MMETSP1339-20121228/3402_1 /TAXON_ID=94617 /ORGANISM="Fibrocapsa japonica" /LENGTH=403 /DNA_ID=CAMNT_0000939003 /DNA_START=76 /DNA_END=1287 /DNA_ORIENTATION=+ /assembly_acc=CAM_ASM_000762
MATSAENKRFSPAVDSTKVTDTLTDLRKIISLDDFQAQAKKLLSKALYEYVASGSDDEQTLAENKQAFKRCFLRPRMMKAVEPLDTRTTIFGDTFSMPVFISPHGVHKLMHSDGEEATSRAAAEAGILMGVSQHATTSLEDVARAAPHGCRWFQAYILKDRELTGSIIQRAVKAGYKAIILTVDSVRFGSREADWRNEFSGLPPGFSLPNYPSTDGYGDRAKDAWDQNTEKLFDAQIEWQEGIALIRQYTDLPIVVKGLLTEEDAVAALDAGASGIFVSNHGGRQVDGCLSSFECLEPIVQAVRSHPRSQGGEKIPVFLDSGVRRGTDVFKALALGASGVFLGRPVFFSLATAGQEGVSHMLGLIREEFEATMALCGCRTLSEITRSHVLLKPAHAFYHRSML